MIDERAMSTMDWVNENRISSRQRPWIARVVSIVVLLLVASLPPVLDPAPLDSGPAQVASARWPALARVVELLW